MADNVQDKVVVTRDDRVLDSTRKLKKKIIHQYDSDPDGTSASTPVKMSILSADSDLGTFTRVSIDFFLRILPATRFERCRFRTKGPERRGFLPHIPKDPKNATEKGDTVFAGHNNILEDLDVARFVSSEPNPTILDCSTFIVLPLSPVEIHLFFKHQSQ